MGKKPIYKELKYRGSYATVSLRTAAAAHADSVFCLQGGTYVPRRRPYYPRSLRGFRAERSPSHSRGAASGGGILSVNLAALGWDLSRAGGGQTLLYDIRRTCG